ncbi:phage tail tape measure protein [Lachnospiraceae bacterium 54-53]
MANRIQGITVEIGGDTTKLTTALKGVNSEIRNTQSQLKDVEKLLKLDPGNTELLAQKQRLLAQAISETKEKLDTLKIAQQQASEALARGEISAQQYDALQREIIETEQALQELEQQASQSAVALQKIGATGEKLQSVGASIESVGKKFLPVTATVAALGTAAVKSAVDFESAFAGVTKTVDGTETQLESIRQGILKLSQSTASSANDIAAVAEAAGQLGVKTEDILQFTETMVRLGDSTNISANEAATAIAKLFNITGTGMSQVGNFGAALVALGNNAATTENDIMNMTTRIAASATQVGMTEQQMLALATSLSSVGLEAEAGGTAISTVITNIDKAVSTNSDSLATWAKTAGMSAEEFKGAWERDAYGALQLVVSGMGDASANGENLNILLEELGITGIRTSDTMKRLSNASEMMGEMTGIANQAWAENTALTEESNKRYETTAAKLSQLKATLTEVGITFGELLLPYVQSAMELLKGLFSWLNSLDEGTKKIIITIALVAAAIGPVLIFVGKIVGSIGTLMTVIPQIATAVSGVAAFLSGTLVPAITGVITFITGTVIPAIGAVVAAIGIVPIAIGAVIAIIILLWNKCEWFRDAVTAIWEAIKTAAVTAWNAISEFLTGLWEGIVSVGQAIWNGLASFFSSVWEGIKTVVSTVLQVISTLITVQFEIYKTIITTVMTVIQTVITTVWNAISTFINTVVTGIQTFLTAAWNTIKAVITTAVTAVQTVVTTIWNVISSVIQTVMNTIQSVISSVWNGIQSVVSNILNAIRTTVTTAFNAVVNGIKGAMTNVYNTIVNGFNNAVGFIKGLASSAFQWGADIIEGIVNGIKSCIGKIKDAVSNVAETIRSFLHFSVPDEGPLTDYESWMPDFMEGLAKGIEQSKGMVEKAVKGVASNMVVNPQVKAADVMATRQTESINSISHLLNGIQDAVSGIGTGNGGSICIPVYLGGTLLDEVVVNAQNRQNLRSGGR